MPSFLKDITPFYGTGEKNSDGKTLEEFLEEYDPYKYRTPCCTTDAVVFAGGGQQSVREGRVKVLLVKRKNHPSIGLWALPGGFINMEENLEETARRELEEETGVKDIAVEQFACYGDWDRDPRARVITTAYMAFVDEGSTPLRAGDDAADAAWCSLDLREGSRETAGEYTETTYILEMENKEKGILLRPVVKRRERRGLIREKKFSVIENGGTAVDHAAVITQAFLILKERPGYTEAVSGTKAESAHRS